MLSTTVAYNEAGAADGNQRYRAHISSRLYFALWAGRCPRFIYLFILRVRTMNSDFRWLCAILPVLNLMWLGNARAEFLDFEISGVITAQDFSDPDDDFPTIEPGDPFTGFLRYDSNTAELDAGNDPNFGLFEFEPPFVPFAFTVEGITFESDETQPPDISVSDNAFDPQVNADVDQVIVFGERHNLLSPEGFTGEPRELIFFLASSDTTTLSGTGKLPTTFDLDEWDEKLVLFGGASSETGAEITIAGEITSLSLAGELLSELRAGDADQDFDFDQLDLVQVQLAAKYLSGTPATWGEGDWDAAPGGTQQSPPVGDGFFDQRDIIAASRAGIYLTGPYAAVAATPALQGDGQTSISYDPSTGEVTVDAPAGVELTSINVDSTAGIFTGDAAQNLGGSFDNDADGNIFKATFGGSFGSLSFGNVANTGLSQEFLLSDLTVVGSLAGGGDLGDVDLIYVPEPAGFMLVLLGAIGSLGTFRMMFLNSSLIQADHE